MFFYFYLCITVNMVPDSQQMCLCSVLTLCVSAALSLISELRSLMVIVALQTSNLLTPSWPPSLSVCYCCSKVNMIWCHILFYFESQLDGLLDLL